MEDVLKKHADVFKEELGKVTGMEVKLHMDPDAQPQFFRPRPVPLALRPKVERELERLVQDKVIEPVQLSEWAAPIVSVVKPNGSVRICGDYKVTVNKYAKTEEYPLPHIEDLFAALSGGQEFTKLDLANAYLQLPLEDKSRQYVTINTHKGLFKYNRLPFVILITGATEEDHLKNLDEVLKRLGTAGMWLKVEKCLFHQEKVRAIKEAPAPKDEQQLQSFLGLLNYWDPSYNLSTKLALLHSLLEKGKVGAVLAHTFPDGSEHPVAFASRTLAPAEKNYSQLDKEGLAIIFGVEKFHNFLFGRQFTIFTDHKPLKHLFGEDKPIPPMASARLQRWALKLSAYQYKIAHKPGKDNANADILSRLPLPEYSMEVTLLGETVMLLEALHSSSECQADC
ncbi:hypothetical protein EMCRGX_G026382 [Ephydatia muelleri]